MMTITPVYRTNVRKFCVCRDVKRVGSTALQCNSAFGEFNSREASRHPSWFSKPRSSVSYIRSCCSFWNGRVSFLIERTKELASNESAFLGLGATPHLQELRVVFFPPPGSQRFSTVGGLSQEPQLRPHFTLLGHNDIFQLSSACSPFLLFKI